jgi:hypothetical protein
MDRIKAFALWVCIGGILTGCQAIETPDVPGVLDNERFMNLWKTYAHCRSGTDIGLMRMDLERLNGAADLPTSVADFVFPLPDFIERLLTAPTRRLAADVKAMAADCALYTGRAALNIGRNEMAAEMFYSVISKYSEPPYVYYVNLARIGLALTDSVARVSDQRLLKALPVSSPIPGFLCTFSAIGKGLHPRGSLQSQ